MNHNDDRHIEHGNKPRPQEREVACYHLLKMAAQDANQQSYPFEIVVVTFPDEGAARVASEGPLYYLSAVYPRTTFLSTCDPLGCRCGSGGGTLAALEKVEESCGKTTDKTILILHAGGDSSRCFTQMALGKAWTNLPLRNEEDGETKWSNPIQLGMDSIARIFSQSHRLPSGSIVIAASDALLSIPHYKHHEIEHSLSKDNNYFQSDVLGVAFPAPWETAKNHGVYVLSEPSQSTPIDGKAMEVRIQKILQKPSLDVLQHEPFSKIGKAQNSEGLAWIDNGIIAFLPNAAKALQELSHGVLVTNTKNGLLKAYNERKKSEPNLTYQDVTHKVDLYTHFLQALTIQGESEHDISRSRHRELYLKDHASDIEESVALGIFTALSPYSFQALAIPEGKFLHLGTTRELKDFYVYGCKRPSMSGVPKIVKPTRYELYAQNCTYFGRELGMVRVKDVFTNLRRDTPRQESTLATISKDCVLMGSVLVGDNSSIIGEGSVVEFCCIERPPGPLPSIQIGRNCLVSGLRDVMDCSQCCHSLRIPDNTAMQMMPLKQDEVDSKGSAFVYMAIGVDDPIKKTIDESTLFGLKIKYFLRWAGMTAEQLWEDSSSGCTLWTAKLHPVITESSRQSVTSLWDWINYLPKTNEEPVSPRAQESLSRWKAQPRLSLSDIREQSDAASEFRHRHELIHSFIPARRVEHCKHIAKILYERRHDECDFSPLLMDISCTDEAGLDRGHLSSQAKQALHTLDDVIRNSLLHGNNYDICGRAFMVASALLDDIARTYLTDVAEVKTCENEKPSLVAEIQQSCARILKTIYSPSTAATDRQRAYDQFSSLRDEHLKKKNDSPGLLKLVLQEFSATLESSAHRMTEICVSGFLHDNITVGNEAKSRKKPVIERWVISTAPSRIDLSGGWSDTPPVCYEYGSTVAGMAVTVDGKKPLSCRCRIVLCGGRSQVESAKGIILMRSELRECRTGNLTSAMEVELRTLADLQDARDPNASCALIKCALICLGLVSLKSLEQQSGDVENKSLQAYVNDFCQMEDGENARLEIVITSLLPQGSGMGTSSILGGCVLAAVGRCVGIEHSDLLRGKDTTVKGPSGGSSDIIDAVSALEQVLSTGGGFQDQVNGLIGGLKTVSSEACQLPIRLTIEPIKIDSHFKKTLDESLMLAFTGRTRLAKGILQNVLRRWARRTPEIVKTVKGLVEGADKAKDALLASDLVSLGNCLDTYYSQKKHMAGEDSGVEPELVKRILGNLKRESAICGASLCGAGGGGFLVMMASPGVDKARIFSIVEKSIGATNGKMPSSDYEDAAFSWHECNISDEGLTTMVLPRSEEAPVTFFDESWHFLGKSSTSTA